MKKRAKRVKKMTPVQRAKFNGMMEASKARANGMREGELRGREYVVERLTRELLSYLSAPPKRDSVTAILDNRSFEHARGLAIALGEARDAVAIMTEIPF